MAGSNWDSFTVDASGNTNEGTFASNGIVFYIYKNWIYVDDPQSWREGGDFIEPTIMQVWEGHVILHDVHVTAWRGPQDGVYTAIWRDKHDAVEGIIGCGVAGFGDDGKWLGVTDGALQFLCEPNGHVPEELLECAREAAAKRRA